MTPLEDCRTQMDTLKARVRLYKEELAHAQTADQRERLRAKLSAYRAAMRDLQVQIDHLDPPERRRAGKERRRLDVGAMPFDWFERGGVCWSDLEGHSWAQVEAGDFVELGTDMSTLHSWLQEAASRLTDRQALYLDAYYNRGLSLETISGEYGVDKSTVSKVIRNGLRRMQEWVQAKRLIQACSDGKGGFDWAAYLSQTPALTDRQRQLMLLVLSRLPKTQEELAAKLELSQTTVCRTLQLGGRTLRKLAPPPGPDIGTPPAILDWEKADKVSLAVQTGMGLGFCYRYCFAGEHVGPLTRYQYELYHRLREGKSAQETARELGIQPRVVRQHWYKLRKAERMGVLHADP